MMNSKRFSWVLYPFLALSATPVITNADVRDDDHLQASYPTMPFLLGNEQVAELSRHVLWRRLLLLSDDGKSNNKTQGLIESGFFLSNTKNINPKNELIAMLSAIESRDEAVLCRFPARVHFLKDELKKYGVLLDVSDDDCADFRAWASNINAKSLSLVFAEEHGNNLAAAFAHTFMRIDSRDDDASGRFATAMNYTVDINRDDGVLSAAIKPLVGGYAGVMEILPYQHKANDYLIKDERDLWEYRLDLTKVQIDQIMRHIWEVRHLVRPYYLTKDNCATEIVRLVDVVRADKALFKRLGAITTPAQVAQLLDDEHVITQTHYHPSNSTKRQFIINNGNAFDVANIKPNDNNPIMASPMRRFGVAISYDGHHGIAHHASFRMGYQGWLDNPAGVRKFHEIILPSFDIKYQDGILKLHDLIVFKATALNPANTAKAYPDGKSHKKAPAIQAYLGVNEVSDASDANNHQHTVLNAHMQKGRSWAIGKGRIQTGDMPDTVCYVLGGPSIQLGKLNQGYRAGVRTALGCVHHHTDRLRIMGELVVPYWYHKDDVGRSAYVQPSLDVGVQYDFDRHHAVRFKGVVQKNYGMTDHQARLEWLEYF
ncbi:DUF4105 domain-containing protein [Moraxella sp. Tifton1]|uniref:DUF4105 domain-containing protein n=1 Tax=Moraxella oculi TaxID=2940516 RepID=A0ABW8U2K6_9GAMM|nr:DUF4105 domain-containing protein [Moraxella sp. Tifton1]MCL1623078.1 DUF4105 domain-containing protein [Moraxella sp. Tifton1]